MIKSSKARQRFTAPTRSSFSERLILVPQQRRQEELDKPALADLDLGGGSHARAERHFAALDHDVIALQADTRRIDQAHVFVLDRIHGEVIEGAVDDAVFGKRKRLELDLNGVADIDKADVLVEHHGLDNAPSNDRPDDRDAKEQEDRCAVVLRKLAGSHSRIKRLTILRDSKRKRPPDGGLYV